jgi:hypothetical protein
LFHQQDGEKALGVLKNQKQSGDLPCPIVMNINAFDGWDKNNRAH